MTLLAYWPATHCGFVWDDDDYVTTNPLLSAPDGLRRIWFSFDAPSQYFPLTYTVFRVEYALWGLNPAGYHWVNILLHAANALLLWRLLQRLRLPGAWLAAALFALHPVQVESVAWVAELKNVLMGSFFLLALRAWVEFVLQRARPRWECYALALGGYALALCAKTTACTLPAALLLVLWLEGRSIDWRALALVVPFVALGLAMGLLAVFWERYHQGTQGSLFSLSLLERVLIAGRAVWFYLGKLVWPANLTFIYPRWHVSATDPLCYVGLVAGGALCGLVLRARRFLGRGPEVALLFFVATLSPMLGFIMLFTFLLSFVADHYQHLACIGPLALAAAGAALGLERLRRAAPGRPRIPAFGSLICAFSLLALLGALTWRQCLDYANAETLYRATIQRNPRCWMAHINLADELLQQGRTEEAIASCRKGLELKPDFADGHTTLANALAQQGNMGEAIGHYEQALQINQAPGIKAQVAASHYNLGAAFLRAGQLGQAIAHSQAALDLNPRLAEAHNNLAGALLRQGQAGQALVHYRKALELNPRLAEAHHDIAAALLEKGRAEEAISHFQSALALRPNYPEACVDLARVLASSSSASLRNGGLALTLAQRQGTKSQCGCSHPHWLSLLFSSLLSLRAATPRFGQPQAESPQSPPARAASPIPGSLSEWLPSSRPA